MPSSHEPLRTWEQEHVATLETELEECQQERDRLQEHLSYLEELWGE